ncbi:MAG: hypothetical protein DBX97_02815 [Collinsella tanakaei]|nr:MAG: hypothetical protein DBX97_02815 [Collinsella tanakaei]
MAPKWLAVRINYRSIKFIYRIKDGVEILKGVRIGDDIACIGDRIIFDGKRFSIEHQNRHA